MKYEKKINKVKKVILCVDVFFVCLKEHSNEIAMFFLLYKRKERMRCFT